MPKGFPMGFLDRLLGRETTQGADQGPAWGSPAGGYPGNRQPAARRAQTTDEQAIERYRYLLRTAPPDQIEQAHREAFATLSPEQRSAVLAELSKELPPGERPTSDDPQQLARAATRAELRNPGTLERSFGRSGGMGMGGMLAGGLLAGVAGAFIGSAIADSMFDTGLGDGGLFDTGGGEAEASGGFDGGSDFGGGDFGGGDFGGF
jgi:hypothetical protein